MSKGVLFVCLGNICRSPTAHGVFQHLVAEAGLQDRIRVDSAGTQDYHPGKPPDVRSVRAARRRGYDLSLLRARQVCERDFADFDYVLAMDPENHADLLAVCPAGREDRVRMFLSFAGDLGVDSVPDPYYGSGEEGFEHVLDLVETASAGLLEHLRAELSK
jgi:low molecular weight protein-tyrosine phosphatase